MSDAVSHAAEVLERRREQLHALDGVIGSGIGASPTGGVAIQVFVRSSGDVLEVERGAVGLLEGIPLEVVVSGDVTGAEVQGGGEDG